MFRLDPESETLSSLHPLSLQSLEFLSHKPEVKLLFGMGCLNVWHVGMNCTSGCYFEGCEAGESTGEDNQRELLRRRPSNWNAVCRNAILPAFYHPALLATCCNVRLHLSGMEGGRITGRVGGGTPSHPLSIYGHEVYTQRGILSLEMMNGEGGRGSRQSVYKEKEGKSLMWNPQQANTYRGAETKRNTFNCFLHLLTQTTSDHLLKNIKRRLKENNHLHNPFSIFPSYLAFCSLEETDF